MQKIDRFLVVMVAVLVVSVATALLVSCWPVSSTGNMSLQPTPSPLLTWETNPDNHFVLATFCCDGPLIEELVRPYIPEAQVWGDGRFLWTEQDGHGLRQVFVKQLSANEMRELLQEIATSGFSDWDEQYMGERVVDAASQCLTVTLAHQNKTVCATHGGAPDTFYTLFEWLSQGAGKTGTLYSPERAYLTGFQLADTVMLNGEPVVAWPPTLAHVPVSEAVTAFWLDEGEALSLLWEATNRSPYHMPVVEDGDGRYRIILQVPGVSWLEP
jgi:hypothetical protein